MSQKQKALAGAILVVVAVGFGFIYNQFSAKAPEKDMSFGTAAGTMRNESASKEEVAIPSTPDAAVDAIIADAALDDAILDNEVNGEKDAITASGAEINNLGQTYDENQL